MSAAADRPHVEIRSMEELGAWLADNHDSSGSVWLVTYKKVHDAHIAWGDVVEELIAWGWIDSAVRSVDETRYKHLISPRKDSSAWSAASKGIVERLRTEGRMHPSGEARVSVAKENGMWTFLDDVERLEVPDDLAEALGPARATFDDWSRSIKRAWLERIKWAKTDPTRAKRIAECARAARENLKNGGLA
ncbi:MAG: YdeI/OmpD-associated family protein [Boseongicola sp. SB0675_bin_26]|nr:YdeI/OmpD-associated family protein [Boseongicola sp. SB0675_bin_26]